MVCHSTTVYTFRGTSPKEIALQADVKGCDGRCKAIGLGLSCQRHLPKVILLPVQKVSRALMVDYSEQALLCVSGKPACLECTSRQLCTIREMCLLTCLHSRAEQGRAAVTLVIL